MKTKAHAIFTKAADIASVILVCLFPVVSWAIFFRLLDMTGTPVWFYVLQGILFIGGIAQLICLIVFGLVRAIRSKGR
ncbi:MAG: hypothetical protein J6Z43_01940 [Clostridiales bacterium]|nr:hypothetical protein [Clostridiales bacterium]